MEVTFTAMSLATLALLHFLSVLFTFFAGYIQNKKLGKAVL
jgi:hypothetical protein